TTPAGCGCSPRYPPRGGWGVSAPPRAGVVFTGGGGGRARGHAAALALFMMALPEFLFFVQPLTSRYSRRREYEADAYAMNHANAQELERALVKLYKDNAATLTPDPLHSAFYDSHPPAAIRIANLAEMGAEMRSPS